MGKKEKKERMVFVGYDRDGYGRGRYCINCDYHWLSKGEPKKCPKCGASVRLLVPTAFVPERFVKKKGDVW